MGSIKHHDRTPPLAGANVMPSQKLQDLFLARLQSERLHYASLSAALARAEESPEGIFDDLNFRAHRLKGAAATFGHSELAAAAGALERACFAAATAHAAHDDATVWEALVALVQMLGAYDPNTLAMALPESAARFA